MRVGYRGNRSFFVNVRGGPGLGWAGPRSSAELHFCLQRVFL